MLMATLEYPGGQAGGVQWEETTGKAGTHSVCDSQAPFRAYGSPDAVNNINAGSHDSCHLLSASCMSGHLSLTTVLHRR